MVIAPREKTIALTIVCKHVGGTGLTPAGAPSTRVTRLQAIARGRKGRRGCRLRVPLEMEGDLGGNTCSISVLFRGRRARLIYF